MKEFEVTTYEHDIVLEQVERALIASGNLQLAAKLELVIDDLDKQIKKLWEE